MPTAFTAPIKDDPNFTFAHFLWLCVRHFGATALLRDDDRFAPLTRADFERAIDTRVVPELERRVALAQQELDEALNWPEERWCSEHRTYLLLAEATHASDAAACEEAAQRYRKILKATREWQPPTDDHYLLKRFMITQIEQSLAHDCVVYDLSTTGDPAVFRDRRIEALRFHLRRAQEHLTDATRVCAERAAWLNQLADSVAPPGDT